MSIAIVDYGMGNLRSVSNAFGFLGIDARIVSEPQALYQFERIVLPGVGAFGDGMRNLRAAGFVEVLDELVRERGVPFLGICLGMQLLGTVSYEHGRFDGLNWIPGQVVQFDADDQLRVPHIGWNSITRASPDPLLADCQDGASFYFVHSYHLVPDDSRVITSRCGYGVDFVATVRQGNVVGAQFHPEKSHRDGLSLLRRFAQLPIPELLESPVVVLA